MKRDFLTFPGFAAEDHRVLLQRPLQVKNAALPPDPVLMPLAVVSVEIVQAHSL